jgi:hypothetical protein
MFKLFLVALVLSSCCIIDCRPANGEDNKRPMKRPINNNWGINFERKHRVESLPAIQITNFSKSIPKFNKRPSIKHDVINRPNSWGMGGQMGGHRNNQI